MKTNSSIAKTANFKPIQPITRQNTVEEKSPVDSVSFSPAGITNRVSTTTKVLTEILERREKIYYSRHYGINE